MKHLKTYKLFESEFFDSDYIVTEKNQTRCL